MAVLKYRVNESEFKELVLPVNVQGGASVKLPNMYHSCADNWPNTAIEYDVSNLNTITFKYKFSQASATSNTKSRVSVAAYMGGYFTKNVASFTVNGTQETIYVLNNVTTEVEGTFTLDVSNYSKIIISISSYMVSSAYAGEAGYVILDKFIAE